MEIKIGGIYRNFKTRNLYKVIGIGKHSETLEDLVFYEALYDNQISKLWARPASMFFDEKIAPDGTKTTRFTFVDEK
jgi:hypothetical protein